MRSSRTREDRRDPRRHCDARGRRALVLHRRRRASRDVYTALDGERRPQAQRLLHGLEGDPLHRRDGRRSPRHDRRGDRPAAPGLRLRAPTASSRPIASLANAEAAPAAAATASRSSTSSLKPAGPDGRDARARPSRRVASSARLTSTGTLEQVALFIIDFPPCPTAPSSGPATPATASTRRASTCPKYGVTSRDPREVHGATVLKGWECDPDEPAPHVGAEPPASASGTSSHPMRLGFLVIVAGLRHRLHLRPERLQGRRPPRQGRDGQDRRAAGPDRDRHDAADEHDDVDAAGLRPPPD